MKEKFLVKDSGVLDQILPLFVGIVMLTTVFALILATMENIQTKNQVDLVARRAILLLETYGYIDDAMRGELKTQLEAAGISDIQITTQGYLSDTREWGMVSESQPASYGQKVEVVITGSTQMVSGEVPGSTIFSTVVGKNGSQVKVVRVSTSKN